MAREVNSRPGRSTAQCLRELRLRALVPEQSHVGCESGRGTTIWGEGMLGLTQAFMVAGGSAVLCSLWKVDDEATSALMRKFYALWRPKAGKGVEAAVALREAQAWTRAQPDWEPPYYWAAWALWGLSS